MRSQIAQSREFLEMLKFPETHINHTHNATSSCDPYTSNFSEVFTNSLINEIEEFSVLMIHFAVCWPILEIPPNVRQIR